MVPRSTAWWYPASGVALAAMAARAPGWFSGRPLWLDEGLALEAARSNDPVAALARVDLHPPLLAMIEGVSPDAWVRLPSAAASLAVVAVGGWTGARWGGAEAGWRMALWAALCPAWVLYGGEARPYALAVLCAAGLLGEAADPRPWRVGAWAAVSVSVAWSLWPVAALAGAWTVSRRGWRAMAPLLPAVGVAMALAPLLGAQLAGPGGALQHGALAGDVVRDPGALPGRLVGWLGYAVVGRRGGAAVAVGLALAWVLAAQRPTDRRPDAALAVLLAGFGAASLLGLHPFGPGRHLLPLTPLLALAWALRADRLAPLGLLAGLWLAAPLPWHDVPCAVDAAAGPVWVDAGAAPTARLHRPDRVLGALGWTDPTPPPTPFLLVATPFPETEAQRAGWTVHERAVCRGARLLEVRDTGR